MSSSSATVAEHFQAGGRVVRRARAEIVVEEAQRRAGHQVGEALLVLGMALLRVRVPPAVLGEPGLGFLEPAGVARRRRGPFRLGRRSSCAWDRVPASWSRDSASPQTRFHLLEMGFGLAEAVFRRLQESLRFPGGGGRVPRAGRPPIRRGRGAAGSGAVRWRMIWASDCASWLSASASRRSRSSRRAISRCSSAASASAAVTPRLPAPPLPHVPCRPPGRSWTRWNARALRTCRRDVAGLPMNGSHGRKRPGTELLTVAGRGRGPVRRRGRRTVGLGLGGIIHGREHGKARQSSVAGYIPGVQGTMKVGAAGAVLPKPPTI